ncbi:protein FAM186A [Zalophus californianus]|uniref:Protein FAM186A n=1 Tax=Zalophus californianus TaxID=9704 RepID=A0A6P9FN03_ZALCA|nr:protein FAM186A [Zalophus californianus]
MTVIVSKITQLFKVFIKMPSGIDSESESEKEVEDSTLMSRKALYKSGVPQLEIPFAVQNVISRIEQAQLYRAREDINMQLTDIMLNVQRIINRYTLDENVHSGRKISLTEYKKRRGNFLEKIVTYAKNAEIREKTLVYILAWLEEWNAILSEMTAVDIEDHHHWIAQMEFLPEKFKAIENNVKILSRISVSLLEEKKRQKKKITSRGTLWKSWKERVIKRPATAHALRPDQIISDEFATNTKVSEIQDMLQELINTTMFNKLENSAIKYISSTIINLSKALSTLNDELKVFNLQSANMYISETSEKEKELSLKIMRELSEKNEMLQQKLQDAEEKYEQFIWSKGVVEPQVGTALPTSTLKVLPELSSQSSTSKADTENSMDDILVKELENIIDETQTKETKGLGIKWDSAISYIVPAEMTPGLIEERYPLLEKKPKESSEDITEDKISLKKGDIYQKDGTDQYQSQNKQRTKGPYMHETSGLNVSDDKGKERDSETKLDYHLELQSLEKKRKEIKSISEDKSKSSTESRSPHVPADYPSTDTKSQGSRSGTSSIWEQFRKLKPEYPRDKSQISSENKEEPTTESMDKETKSEMSSQAEQFGLTQLGYSSEKVKIKGKKHHVTSETTTSKQRKTEEDILVLTKKVKSHGLVKPKSRVTEETSESTRVLGSPDGKSEESNLEEFQKAIMAFLKEKIDNIGKPLDKKTVPKEELLLKMAEVEKLGIIKAKIEEYFQNVAETVTKTLRKYKDIKSAGQVGEKPMKRKKEVSFMPGLHFQKPISAKTEISTLLSSKSMDPLTDNLIQMILTEIEGERDAPVASTVGRDHKEEEKQRREEHLQEGQEKIFGKGLKHQLQEGNFWKKGYEMINKKLLEEESWLQMKEGKQGQQKQKQRQEEEMRKEQQKQRMQKQTEQDEEQTQREEEEDYQKLKQQQLEAWNRKMEKQALPLEKEKGQQKRHVQKEMRHQELEINWEKEEKQRPRRNVEDHERQRQKKTKDQMKINEKNSEEQEKMFSQTSMILSPRWKTIPKVASQLHQRKEFHGHLKALDILADGKQPIPTTPPSTQSPSPEALPVSGQNPTKFLTLTPQQAQAQGITLTPQQAQALGMTLSPQQAQALGITLTPQQAEAQGITLTPQQAQAQGITLTPQQAQALGITLTPQQAEAQGITLTPQQAQAQGITLTPQQAQALGMTLTPQQAQALGITLTPEQAQALGMTLTPQQAQVQGITLTPQQAQAQGITLTTEQAQALGITLIPQQAQVLGITLTPEQAQALGITLTPQQAQAQGITLTPQQAQAQGITLTPQQAQALGMTLSPQQAQAQGITLTPELAQAPGITLTPQQAQAQGITLTPQQAQALGMTLTPQQAQVQGITLTPQQAQAQGITLTTEQAQALGITLTPEQAQVLGITLTPEQAQALGITLTPQQAQAQGITLTPQQAQAQGITLTPQQAQALGMTLTPQQAQALGITLTPEQAQTLGMTLSPQQAQALGITLTTEQAQALGITLTPEQAQALGITLTPEQAQALGITLTPQQAQAQGITLTPQQAQALGMTLTPQQAQALGITLTPEQAQTLGMTLSPQQAQALGITLTPEQAQALGMTLTPQQAQAQGITLTPQQAQAQGITLTPQQAQALGITLTPQQAQAQGITLTPEQAWELGVPITLESAWLSAVTLTPEQTQALGAPLSLEQAQALGVSFFPEHFWKFGVPLTSDKFHSIESPLEQFPTLAPSSLRSFQRLKASVLPGKSITSSPRQAPASVPIAEKSSVLEVSSTPLQISGSPLSQDPGKLLGMRILSDPGKLLAPQTFPSSKQILVSEGQSTSVQFVAPEVPLSPGKFALETLLSSRKFLRDSWTPQLPLISEAPLAPRQPLISGVPLSSAQIPSLLAPLSPRKPLVSGTSSILESRPLTLSEQPQAFQPPPTYEQSLYLQVPSTLGQHHASPLWIPPTPGHPPTLWTSPTPGKPQKDVSSSISKKSKERLAIISSLKSKSVPFTAKDFQISEVSDTSEEIQTCHDPIAMEQFRTFQSYLTDYRTPVSQTPYIGGRALPPLMKPLTMKLPKTSQISSSEWDQKTQFPPIDKSWILTSDSVTKKPKMMVSPSSPQELKEQRYFVDVEAQRKNLILLNQATKSSRLPSQLHATARNLIIETLHMDIVRLGYLFRKYIAYRLIQRARNNIIRRLQAIQNTGKGYETQKLFIMLSRIDDYQKKMMQVWTNKQKSLEQKRNQCLGKMMFLFSQLQGMYKLNLSQPIPLIIDNKQIPASTKFVQQPFLELLIEDERKSDTFKKFRQQEDQIGAIWNADLSTSSYPITEKISINSLWAQLGGYPDIPMLLQLDVQSTFRKSLASIKSQFKKIPK